MGKRRQKLDSRSSQTLPPSPSHSSSSSDFEFTISLSPRKSSPAICPADELFYKGQLLPLHLSPRISMVRTLLLASSSTSSSSDTTTTASRDSTGSSSSSSSASSDLLLLSTAGCDSSRPSSVTDDDCKRLTSGNKRSAGKYFSLSRFSSVFKKEHSSNLISKGIDNNNNNRDNNSAENINHHLQGGSSVRRMSVTAKEVIRKYLKKVKPLYEKLSQKQQLQSKMGFPNPNSGSGKDPTANDVALGKDSISGGGSNTVPVRGFSHSFSGNLRYPRKRSCATSCPSSMRSSPSHSGVLSRGGFANGSGNARPGRGGGGCGYGDVSSMEELQSAIQGAITHCKNSMMQQGGKAILISNEI